MRVLFISRKYPPQVGGMEKQNYAVVQGFPARSRRVIALRYSQKHLVWFLPYALVSSLFLVWFGGVKLVHLGDGLLAPIGYVIKKLSRARVTVTIHGLDVTYRNSFYQRVVPFCLSKLDRLFCVSNYTVEQCVARGIRQRKCVFVPNGIYPGEFSVNYSEDKSFESVNYNLGLRLRGKKVLLSVGRLVRRKGIHWFVANVFERIVKREPDAVFVVVGDGPEMQRIKQLVTEKNLKDRVFLAGRVSDALLRDFYNVADVFVMPNVLVKGDMEGFGIVAIEAASSGLPVVASGIEGIQDAVRNGVSGVLVNPYDADSFESEICMLLRDERRRKEFGRKAKKFVEDNFSWARVSALYQNEFEDVVSR